MKLLKFFTKFTILFLLVGCGGYGGPSDGNFLGDYGPGQWDYPEEVGKEKYLLRGYGSREAIKGAKQDCIWNRSRDVDRIMEMIDLIPARGRTMAVITYKCVPKK